MPADRPCIGFGRIIESDRPVRGTVPNHASLEEGNGIRIGWQSPVAAWADDDPLWSLDGDALVFSAGGVARYRCTRSSIMVEPVMARPDTASDMVDALLVATALPAVLWLQGAFVLHSAAILAAGDQGALAIAGRSGCGKSHLAAAFLAKGARLIADDSIAISGGAPRTPCAGLAGGYHLGEPGAEERAFHAVPDHQALASAPLATIVVLDDDSQPPARLAGVAAVATLLAQRHRASVPRYCGLEAQALDATAHLARTVPIYRWPRREADALLDDAVRREIMCDGEDR